MVSNQTGGIPFKLSPLPEMAAGFFIHGSIRYSHSNAIIGGGEIMTGSAGRVSPIAARPPKRTNKTLERNRQGGVCRSFHVVRLVDLYSAWRFRPVPQLSVSKGNNFERSIPRREASDAKTRQLRRPILRQWKQDMECAISPRRSKVRALGALPAIFANQPKEG